MRKVFVGVAVGVFVGAIVAEMIRNPAFLQGMGARIKRSAKAAREAFMEGYVRTRKPSLSL